MDLQGYMSGAIRRIMEKAYRNVLGNPREAKTVFRLQQIFLKSTHRYLRCVRCWKRRVSVATSVRSPAKVRWDLSIPVIRTGKTLQTSGRLLRKLSDNFVPLHAERTMT